LKQGLGWGGRRLLPISVDVVARAAVAEPTIIARRRTPNRNPLPTLTFITPPGQERAIREAEQSTYAVKIG